MNIMKDFSIIDYNPFNKEISCLRKSDLNKLIVEEVAEGWYVEYKEEFPASKKIGHSIASFSNSEGGWYVVGVKANQDNVAESIIGFDITNIRSPKDKIRDIIKNHISPIPFFESKLIKLTENRAVLIVYIEKGYETPYVTRDGKIYRRVGEGSDPIPETDRYSVQKLFERSNELKERVEAFSQNPFFVSELQTEQNQCFLEAYFYTLPFNKFRFRDFYTKQFFNELCTDFSAPVTFLSDSIKANIPFDKFYSSSYSYILRHVTPGNDIVDIVNTITIELFRDGNIKVFIPIQRLPTKFLPDSLPEIYRDSVHFKTFLDMISGDEFKALNVIDGYNLFTCFAIIFNKYCKLLKKNNFQKGLTARLRFSNSWKRLLYFDDEQYLIFLKEYGFPICLKSKIEIPEFYVGRGIPISLNKRSMFGLILLIFEALGLPRAFVLEFMYGMGGYISDLAKNSTQ